MMSRIPPDSPAGAMLVNRESKALGCVRMASASEEPDSTSERTCWMTAWRVRFSSWSPRISRHCTRGRPASSITENWRVKMAMRLEPMPRGMRGISLISRPFSRRLVIWICWRRSTAAAASRESARSCPSWIWPDRVFPFQMKLGMLKAPLRGQRGVEAGGAAVDDLLQLVRIGRAGEGRLQRDQPLEVQGGQRLVEGLHPVLGLAGLHHAVDLVHLVLADQVADGGAGDQDLNRHRATLALRLG